MQLYIAYTVVLNDWVVTTEAASGIAIAAPASCSCWWYRYNDTVDGKSLAGVVRGLCNCLLAAARIMR